MTDVVQRHVFFLDDEPEVRQVVKETLEGQDIKVTCFACPIECLAQLRSERCDLLITDLRMPEKDGIELLTDVKHLAPHLPVLMITGYGDVPTAVEAIKGGAADFIEKPLVKEGFLRKVRTILEQSAMPAVYTGGPLTMAEMNVLRLIVDGKSNREIADFLHRSIRTVETHRAAVMHKFGVNSLVDLIKRVAAMGLVDLKTKQPFGAELKAEPPPGEAVGDSENGLREEP